VAARPDQARLGALGEFLQNCSELTFADFAHFRVPEEKCEGAWPKSASVRCPH
jgi:hypothetical protein